MADLQDEADVATAGIGAPDRPASQKRGEPEAPAPGDALDPDVRTRLHTLLRAHPVADGYNTLAQVLVNTPWHDVELGESSLDTDIPRLRHGGVGAQFWSLMVAADCPDPVSATLERVDRLRTLVDACPEGLRLARAVGDLADARNHGRIASLFGPVAAHALGDSLGTVRAYHALGVRAVALTTTTSWTRAGLTRFGQEVVRELNRLGMVIDLSGAAPETIRQTLGAAKAPVIFTRSAARALTDHPLNVTDEVVEELPENGGVCLVSFSPAQVAGAGRAACVQDVADHVEHLRGVVGPGHIGLSGGYGLTAGAPRTVGLEDASCYPVLLAELLARGWDDTDLAALTWGNFARVIRDVDFAARAAQPRRGPSTATIEDLDPA
ncbi:dipeptidase [Streptomyces sp. TLI_146]|uniref:dipeptidase n=1 Tax=Streptomyces sp. TLI_146 TaxID=1938858 RepID=UPI000C705743|nr:dipeptidase [Streptomyces sp. TLI_146]PKV86098.1 microsomal dipeptidase-like Zn-dependent dipeptidase [Streptomyces sp. TLI_146]